MHVPHPVNEAGGLALEGGPDARVRMPRHGDAESTCEVEVDVAVDVSHVGPRGGLPEDGKRLGQVRYVPGLHPAQPLCQRL